MASLTTPQESKTNYSHAIKQASTEQDFAISGTSINGEFDFVVSVISTRKNRFLRLKKSKLMTKKTFNNIIKHQTTDRLRKEHSNIIIFNNQSLKKYIININNILDILVK